MKRDCPEPRSRRRSRYLVTLNDEELTALRYVLAEAEARALSLGSDSGWYEVRLRCTRLVGARLNEAAINHAYD